MRRASPLFAVALAAALAGCTTPPAGEADRHRPITIEEVLAISQAGAPAWSPDGRQLAFAWGQGTERDLWVVDADATGPARPGDSSLRQVAPLVARGGASVSPDWRRMAFTAKRHIWVLPLEGGRPVQVTTKEGEYSALRWSPDSTRIAFVVTEKDQQDVGVVSADGGAVTMITTRGGRAPQIMENIRRRPARWSWRFGISFDVTPSRRGAGPLAGAPVPA